MAYIVDEGEVGISAVREAGAVSAVVLIKLYPPFGLSDSLFFLLFIDRFYHCFVAKLVGLFAGLSSLPPLGAEYGIDDDDFKKIMEILQKP